ncbi:MAG: hypothetical protein SGI92_29225 [Bryobacteraceae bacterium]|nr:hypothetical protein [Bryobacteraceae bacterium]
MRRTLSGLILLSSWLALYAQSAAATTKTTLGTDELEEAVQQLSKITGLQPLKKVRQDTITREGVRKFLEQKLKEEVKPEDIRLEELALKKFGLVPQEFDLKSATVDLITEQAAAFYDFRTKKLYLLEGDDTASGMAGAQKMIVVHELAHALADQHFDLGKFIRKSRSDDASTARMAVMEGQATWLMMESMVAGIGQSMRTMPSMAELMGTSATEAMASQYPVLAKAPLYLRASLIFPYNQGLKFQQALVVKLGNAGFSQVFQKPPVSSQQILHPEKYFAGVEPVKPTLPDLPKGWKKIHESTVGELEHAILIEQYLSKGDATDIAPAWKGGSLALVENKAKQTAMLYASEWDTPENAKRFFDAYIRVLAGKWKKVMVDSDSPAAVTGSGDSVPFSVRLDGTRVTSAEGLR